MSWVDDNLFCSIFHKRAQTHTNTQAVIVSPRTGLSGWQVLDQWAQPERLTACDSGCVDSSQKKRVKVWWMGSRDAVHAGYQAVTQRGGGAARENKRGGFKKRIKRRKREKKRGDMDWQGERCALRKKENSAGCWDEEGRGGMMKNTSKRAGRLRCWAKTQKAVPKGSERRKKDSGIKERWLLYNVLPR